MSRYHNPIHAPVFPSQVSSYSTLSGALASPPCRFNSQRRRRVPQAVCKTHSGPMCAPITFDYIGQVGQGVSLADFSARSQNLLGQMVTGANDLVLAGSGVKAIRLHVMWNGYEHMGAKYGIPATPATSRGQLGANIAMQLWAFVDEANKTSSTNPQWVISPRGIRFDKIVLVALYHIGDDVWQADLAVDF
ncbi:hypothetical protein P691DRAFT_739131 [Macrolepiota fuliginosa MF-IS2]|uniref:Uncharacterized protein n=1 Tax=Macrolepiota fuliginosa MF-IS2 TaxID=1400762 RepID=A0A9P5WZZ6_9AGAR|nr:hypothetical protein P691DRAFT_739131 [Macrolepiota fuliginosa MF-IS2]